MLYFTVWGVEPFMTLSSEYRARSLSVLVKLQAAFSLFTHNLVASGVRLCVFNLLC